VIRLEAWSIILVSCGTFDKPLTGRVATEVQRAFRIPVSYRDCPLDFEPFYNPVRRQYDANAILRAVSGKASPVAVKTIGLLRVDLYIPILTYIFGQAPLNGHAGIASLYRLRNELYGLVKDDGLLIERFSKVVVHELGHTFGLIHCTHPVCIMRSSTYVEDLDQKDIHFCPACRELLDAGIPSPR
jgi:archaemetzincin